MFVVISLYVRLVDKTWQHLVEYVVLNHHAAKRLSCLVMLTRRSAMTLAWVVCS